MDYRDIMRRKLPTVFLIAFLLVFLTLTALLNGCKQQIQEKSPGKLSVVATTTMLRDLVSVIGGDKADVKGLMGPGVDPHLYKASAGDVAKMQGADIVVYNGLHLEGRMGEVFASLKDKNKKVICIEDGLEKNSLLTDENDPKLPDPHIWFDVMLWKEAAGHVTAKLSEIDPQNAPVYTANFKKYSADLDELNRYIVKRVEELPESQRVLITAHDAFRYFGKAYNVKVMGLQGISTDAEAGTADVSRLADFIAERRIKAVFPETSVPAKSIEALQAAVKARGFAVNIGGELYSDSLGDAKSGADTYILTVKANADTIINALK